MSKSELVFSEVESRVNKGEKIFQWTLNGVVVADIALYADGLVEFNSKRSGDVVVERIGSEYEIVYTYKPEHLSGCG